MTEKVCKKFLIYKYKNKINGLVYIGQTYQSIKQRAKNGLAYKNNKKFWNDIQKYGWNNFEVEILYETENSEDANYYEKYYIDYFNAIDNGYNNKNIGSGIRNFSEKSLEKLSDSGRKNYDHSKHDKKVYQFSEDKKLLNEFSSAAEAARIVNGNKAHITACCKGKRNIHAGYYWSYFKTPPSSEKYFNRKVYQFNKDTLQFIKEWNSAKEAAEFYKFDKNRILEVCAGREKSARGFIWSYEKKIKKN